MRGQSLLLQQGRRGFQEASHQEEVLYGRERLQIACLSIQGGSGIKRLGDIEPGHGTRKEGTS